MSRGASALGALALVLAAAAFSAPALAGPAEDGNAGLQAMDRGDYAGAERLFTRVLKSPGLSSDDRAAAYFNRGKSYLRQGRYIQASADLTKALELTPADTDARNALALADLGKSGADAMAVQWGGYNLVAGGSWVRVETHEDKKKHREKTEPVSYLTYSWTTQGQELGYTGTDRGGNAITGYIQRDANTGQMSNTVTFKGQTVTNGIEPIVDGFIETSDQGATRVTVQRAADGGFDGVQESYANNTWTRVKSFRLEQSTTLQAEVDRNALGRRALKCLGEGARSGVLTSLFGAAAPATQQSVECGGQQQDNQQ